MLAVIQFPGSNDDRDMRFALKSVLGASARLVWHKESELPTGTEAVLLPGGFSYGDYLRCGAMARFSPILSSVAGFAARGGPVLGTCNGFQILCEAGLLAGAFIANRDLSFICRFVELEVVETGTILTRGAVEGQRIRIPLNSYEGNWVDPTHTGRAALRYVDDPNGSQSHAAAIANDAGNVAGIMPHPERAADDLLGSADGNVLLRSYLDSLVPA